MVSVCVVRSGGPKQLKDAEELTSEVELHKKRYAAVAQENVSLRTQVQRLTAQLRKKEKQMQHVLDMKVVALNNKTGDSIMAGKLQELRKDLVTIHRLSEQNRALEQAVTEKEEELKVLKSSMKFTLIKELQVCAARCAVPRETGMSVALVLCVQIEAETYYTEARRLKAILDRRMGSASASASDSASHHRSGASSARLHSSSSTASASASAAPASTSAAPASGAAGSAGGAAVQELERMRQLNRQLTTEITYLRSEREDMQKAMERVQHFKNKMKGVQNQLTEAQVLPRLASPHLTHNAFCLDPSNACPHIFVC